MSLLFDCFSLLSVVGIWPRFIEPKRLAITHLPWKLPADCHHLQGKRFVHLSDLHFYAQMSQVFLDKIVRRVLRQKPDVIFFTGDFICYSQLENKEKLKAFLCRLQAPYGSYCVFGNHDYAQYVSCDATGLFDIRKQPNPITGLIRGLKTLLTPSIQRYLVSEQAQHTPAHEGLIALLRETPFTLLENTTITLPMGLNITGLGDYALGRTRPETAFSGYNGQYPGIVLTHNPDTIPQLLSYPSTWILAGHTHGEQIHLPGFSALSKKLTRLINCQYTRGYYAAENKHLYVTRGLGSPKPFRLFSPPEVVVIEGVKS